MEETQNIKPEKKRHKHRKVKKNKEETISDPQPIKKRRDSDLYKITKKRRFSQSKSEDDELELQFLNFADSNTVLPEIIKLISKYWFNLKKSGSRGYAGFILASELNNVSEDLITEKSLEEIYDQLDAIRTTITDINEAILFYFSSLSFYIYSKKNEMLKNFGKFLVEKSINTYTSFESKRIIGIIKKVLAVEPKHSLVDELSVEFNKIKESYESDAELYLYKNVIDIVDCELANTVIIHNYLRTMEEVIRANTNISRFITKVNDPFPVFRQIILLFIAHEDILANPDTYEHYAPSIPPNVAYILFCSLQVDVVMPKPIAYETLDKFATVKNCDLAKDIHSFLFKPKKYDLPEKCNDFEFV